jgi:type I restriction enzyme S subunit
VARSDGVVVPKLRFPEFRAAQEWITMKLNEACDVNPENSELPEEFAYIDLESVEAGELKARKIISRDEAPSRAQRLLRYGDVIFQIVRPYQRNNFLFSIDDDVHYVASTGYAQLRANESADFLYQAVHTDDFVERVIAKCTGSSYPAINSSDLADISIAIPGSDEQQKIADSLASLDERITLEAQKLDTLKTHKKGLMQQLFPAEGETLPKLRFPEFRDAGGWKVKSVGDFGDVVTGSTPSTVRPEFYGGGIPFVSPADISDLRFVNGTKTTLTALGFAETRPIKANSVLFVCIGSTIGKVTQNVRGCATNQQLNSVIPNAEHSGGFVYYILSLNAGRIANLAGKQAVPIINKTQFSAVRLPVPELREQERVAACLASIDDLITAQTQKLAALKTHKKGLMQQLFPALEEVAA